MTCSKSLSVRVKQPYEQYYELEAVAHRLVRERGNAYRQYRKRKLRQQRLTLLAFFLLMIVAGMAGGALWLGSRQGVPLPQISILPRKVDTTQFEALVEEQFGPAYTPSPLYANNLARPLLKRQMGNELNDTLLPMLTTREDAVLKARLAALINSYPPGHFSASLYYYNPLDGSFVEINGYQARQAASVIKLPVLYNYLLSLDEDTMRVDTPLLYADFHRAGGAGELQYKPAGITIPANDVATNMIRISDNTDTNIMIDALGGSSLVNRRLQELGLRQTRIHNWLPDLEGTNKVSPYEMATILHNIDQGLVLSQYARQIGLDILEGTHNNRLLPWLLPKTVKVAHKTGDIGTALGDSGLFYLPDGRRYILCIQVERPYNDYTAKEMMQQASLLVYNYQLESTRNLAASHP